MGNWNAALQWLERWVWQNTWQASIAIVLVLALQWSLRKWLSPGWRHALWLIVVLRLALPLTWPTSVSVYNLMHFHSTAVPETPPVPPAASDEETQSVSTRAPAGQTNHWRQYLVWAWLAGVLGLPSYLGLSTWRLGARVRRQRPLIDAWLLNLLEDCKQEMGLCTPITLIETPAVSSPSLFGFVRPRLLLPEGLASRFSPQELRYIFLHELSHLKRGDIVFNWLAITPLMLHWFNPLVWFAVHRMRADGELACDHLALTHTRGAENQSYGRTILKLLENFTGPALGPGMVGILENKNEMKRRIDMIAKFRQTTRWPRVSAAAFAALALVTLTDAQPTSSNTTSAAPAKPIDPTAPPAIVSTSPAVGQLDVDPAIKEITITFDRDMSGGFSWTGGGPEFPPSPAGAKARWIDQRTCSLPVQLERAKYYRVGINSTSYRNFKSAQGVPARPSAIYFTTVGADESLKWKCETPVIVAIEPADGAKDVDPSLTELKVTFNVPMGGGFSWTGSGPNFPAIPEGKKPYWSEDKKTCFLPVELKPGWSYRLGLNSPSHKNFQSAGGVPLDPVTYAFKTR
jgi:beta-lactamase regulating signal transducer with metallopeptidase domain